MIEVVIALAIVGVLTALSITGAQALGARNATQNAAADLSTVLQGARARAERGGADVYVLVYPTMKKSGALTGGPGAVFVYEDLNGDFVQATGPCNATTNASNCGWANFTPPLNIYPTPNSSERLIQAIYLEDYSKQNVRFGKATTVSFTAPFSAIGTAADANGCSFCSATRGAVVFTGDQQLRFLDGTGARVAQRVAGLSVQSVATPANTFLFGLVAATSLVTTVR